MTAPVEIESTPIYGATNFTENTIIVEFNEFIKLNNLSSQLIVSPLMDPVPEITIKGKKLVIKIKSELAENTTYCLNFGTAISDITENNDTNYKYVFSTGAYIDSLSYSGRVINAFDLKPQEKVYTLLYDQLDDSIPLKERPRYVAITNKEGEFSITNIAKGKYKFFAINDINSNYLFDLPNEEIAFQNEPIQLDSSSFDHLIYLFEENNTLQFLKSAENNVFGKVDIILNNPTKDLVVTPIGQSFKKQWYIEEKNTTGDSLTMWLLVQDAFKNLELEIKDGNDVIDTADVKIIQSDEFKDTSLFITTNTFGSFDLNQNITIDITRPFVDYKTENIRLLEDSMPVTSFNISVVGVNRFELAYDFKENKEYDLIIAPNTFEDIFGLKNDSLYSKFKTKKESDYGMINLTVSPDFSENYIIQLFQKDNLIQESYLKDSAIFKYNYLRPGDYEMKLIIDNNNDRKWNTGNYLEGKQPEKVIYYEKEIKIKANWDNDINWIITE